MDKIRVVLVGLGPIGIITLKEALRREAIEVAGELISIPPSTGRTWGRSPGERPAERWCGRTWRPPSRSGSPPPPS